MLERFKLFFQEENTDSDIKLGLNHLNEAQKDIFHFRPTLGVSCSFITHSPPNTSRSRLVQIKSVRDEISGLLSRLLANTPVTINNQHLHKLQVM